MRTAMLPTFRKLYGIIEDALFDGDHLSVIIENNYNTYLFGGRKHIVFSTTSWLGGKNHFLGFLYIAAGCLCILVGCMYFLLHVQFPRDVGDERFLSWKRKDRWCLLGISELNCGHRLWNSEWEKAVQSVITVQSMDWLRERAVCNAMPVQNSSLQMQLQIWWQSTHTLQNDVTALRKEIRSDSVC